MDVCYTHNYGHMNFNSQLKQSSGQIKNESLASIKILFQVVIYITLQRFNLMFTVIEPMQ